MNLFMSLVIAASSMLFNASILSTSPQRTLFWKSMMVALKIFSKNFMMVNTSLNLKNLRFGMSIVSLMILLLTLSNQTEVLFGPVRTMMVMSNLILLLKDMALSVLWLQSLLPLTAQLKLRQLTALLHAITVNTRKVKKLLQIQSPPFSLGLVV